jgi:hypothetical protein
MLDRQGFRRVLESLVGCDCDNGVRVHPSDFQERCTRCVLVEVGGVKVRVQKEKVIRWDAGGSGVGLPAVEVSGDEH